MNPDVHERAGQLLDALHVEDISDAERTWLDAHLGECPACQARAQATQRALQTLRSGVVSVDPALVGKTQARVRLRARELRENQVRMRALWISCALSWVLGVASAPLVWQAFEWIGLHAALPKLVWESAFALWWLLPAAVAAGLIAWQRRRASTEESFAVFLR